MSRLLIGPLFFLALLSSPAVAQNGVNHISTEGLIIAPRLNGTAWTLDELGSNDAEFGPGLSVLIGYGVSDLLTLFADVSAARIEPEIGDKYGLAHFDLGARLTLRGPSPNVGAYVDGALSGRAAEWETVLGTIKARGIGISIGGGGLYFFSPSIALDVGLRLTFGDMSEIEVNGQSRDIEERATSARLSIGISWYAAR